MQKALIFILAKLVGLYINILSFIAPKKAGRLAYGFFTGPRSGKLVKDSLPGILREATAEIVTQNDLVFQTYTWPGNHTKVLLVHGWESNASRWKLLISYLKKSGCTIIAIDAPAHGLTAGTEFSIPRYAEFIDCMVQLHKPQYMVGHSLGGATALFYQSHYKNSTLQKLVTLGAPCDFITIMSNFKHLLSLNGRVLRYMDTHLRNSYKIDPNAFSCSLFASKITIPGLIAHDKKDKTVAYTEGEKIAKAWPAAQFITTKGVGHSMHDMALYEKIFSFLFDKDEVALNANEKDNKMAI
ncbi:MAG: alpha/beta fold hydrolase [Bacteroidota bacterium]